MADSHVLSLRRLAFAGVFAGLAWGAGYVSLIPNVELLTVLLFAGGWVVGPRWGALAAALGEGLHTVFNPYGSALAMHPLLGLTQVLGMAASGAVGGWLGARGLRPGRARWALVVASGVAVTFVFDLLTNLATGIVFGQMATTLWMAVPFALLHEGSNAVLFATAGTALVAALEGARRSLLPARAGAPAGLVALALAGVLAAAGPGLRAAGAQAALKAGSDTTGAARDTALMHAFGGEAEPESPAEKARAARALRDSIAYRDRVRSRPAPAWGEGPAELQRRDDASVSELLTREGGFVERWADERGSAEPLGRFGVASPRAVLVDWLGLPLSGVGAVGGELTRVALPDVGGYEAPRLPVSAREAYRGELGEAALTPLPSVPRHLRVLGWAATGGPDFGRSGFASAGRARSLDGFLAVAGGSVGRFEPLGPEGDHTLAARLAWHGRTTEVTGAFRSSRLALEDSLGRAETRAGQGGSATVAATGLGLAWQARFERTVERTHDASDLIGESRWTGTETRGSLSATRAVGGADVTARFTAARQTLGARGTDGFAPRRADLWWGSLETALGTAAGTRLEAALGAGEYAHGGVDVAPSLLLTRAAGRGRTLWAGAARGLSAGPDPRTVDGLGNPLGPDTAPVRSSTWLAGAGVTLRGPVAAAAPDSAGPPAPTWRGPWPRGAHRLRAAAWAGRTAPGRDPLREPFAGASYEDAPTALDGLPTRWLAFTATGAWAVARGLVVDAGGLAMGREVDPLLPTADPEARAHLTLEARRVFFAGALDARLSATGEWIGRRLATPAGDLPSATRLSVVGHAIVDEFEVRLALLNALGSNRALPLPDPASGQPVPATQRAFRAEVRWTFWD